MLATQEEAKAQTNTFGGRAGFGSCAARIPNPPIPTPPPIPSPDLAPPPRGSIESAAAGESGTGRSRRGLGRVGLGWWEPGSHGVGAGALLLRRPVAQGASRGREEAGMPVCCLLVARNVDLGHTQSLIVEQHVRVQRRGIGGIVLLSAMTIVHSIVSLAI